MGKKNSANKENPETFGNTDLNLDENFYDVGDIKKEQDDQKDYEKSKKKKIIVIIILAVILAVLVFFLIFKSGLFKKDNTPKPEISLLSKELNLKNGESANISFTILNTSVNGTASFESSDSSVVTVDNNGKVVAVGEGKAIITVIYDIEGKKITNTCNVVVEKSTTEPGNNGQEPTDNPTDNPGPNNPQTDPTPGKTNTKAAPSLTLSFTSGKENTWTNKDVVIKTTAKSNSGGALTLKYTVNCNKDCSYTTVKNNTITVINEGASVVTVYANDSYNNQTVKSVTVKIDKTKPKVTLSPNNVTTTSTTDIEMCAICQDADSKCKQDKVCKKYTASASNQTLTVEDNAGNKSTTNAFNVVINKNSGVTGVTLNKTTLSLTVGTSETLKATIAPSTATNKNVTWTSSNTSVATVSNGTVKGIKPGTATITVKTQDGLKTATCKVTVCGWVEESVNNQTSCTASKEPTSPKAGDSYITCKQSGYTKYRYVLYDKNNNRKYSSYQYESPAAATSACKSAGGVTCKYERSVTYTKTTNTYKCS